MIEEKIKEFASRRAQFESELVTANMELERLQSAIVKGTADTDSLVAAQTRVNAVSQTITAFDSQLAALETDLIYQKSLETKKEIFSKIKVLDDDAEKAGSRFIEFYSDTKNLSYARFAEMASLIAGIADLKADFGRYVTSLIPDVNKLKSYDLPEVQTELDNLISELQNTCKLSVLRSDVGFSVFGYPTDSNSAFRLPDVPLSDWIWLSIRRIREREQEKPAPEKKRGFWDRS
jgi:hypothetical protein